MDAMLREASFVWNHALALQKRYYSLFGGYISKNAIQKHYAKRIRRTLLHSQATQEFLERLDTAYQRFFKKLTKRPPKFRKAINFCSIVYKQGGFSLNGNTLTVNTIKKRFKFSYSRPYEGMIKYVVGFGEDDDSNFCNSPRQMYDDIREEIKVLACFCVHLNTCFMGRPIQACGCFSPNT